MEEVLFKCTIPGRPGIKKNSKQIAFNKKTGRRFVKSSDRYEAWELAIAHYIVNAKLETITFPVNVAVKLYYKNHQWESDLTNAVEGVFDMLQKCEILSDDKLIYSVDGSRKIFDEPNERIEVVITRFDK